LKNAIIIDGVQKIIGPLIFLDYNRNVGYNELVEIIAPDGEIKHGSVLEVNKDYTIIEVFEKTTKLSLNKTRVRFLGSAYQMGVSLDMLGRIFDGKGVPRDGIPKPFYEEYRDINGNPINPVMRKYPEDFIQTGISAIDCMFSLVRGQKLPIFSGFGLPHNKIAGQIISQSTIHDSEEMILVFAAMGITQDEVHFFRKVFEESGVFERVTMFLNLADDPTMERLITPRLALTFAEFLAFTHGLHILVILSDMSSYAEALREVSSLKGEIPSRKGFPGYLYTDLASIYERAGKIKGIKGSITQIPILSMPNDDITHPIPDLTGYITEGQIVLDRELANKGIYPPIKILDSLSRLMKDGIGLNKTREDHPDLANQLYASFAKYKNVEELALIIGESELSKTDRLYIEFGKKYINNFLKQDWKENRSIDKTLDLAWETLSVLPESELERIHKNYIEKYFKGIY